jgi:S1-C subfamily serine protease
MRIGPCRARAWFVSFAALLLLPWPARGQDGEGGEKLYQRLLKSTVWVLSVEDDRIVASGTGSLVDLQRRLVVTNFHVVDDNDEVFAFFPARAGGLVIPERSYYLEMAKKRQGIPGKVLARDKKKDLALVQLDVLPDGVQEVKLARDSAKTAQRVHSVGNPGKSGALWVYSKGDVRQVYHKVWKAGGSGDREYEFDAQVVETQSPTNAGDSGGPVVNDRGELVGVTQGTVRDAQLLGLAIDVSEVKALLKKRGVPVKMAAPPVAQRPAPTPEKPPAKAADAGSSAERVAAQKLALARTLADEGKTTRARERLQALVKDYANTAAAREAEDLLKKLDK